eukprot:6253828-Pyramimonas_sp.AAC.1
MLAAMALICSREMLTVLPGAALPEAPPPPGCSSPVCSPVCSPFPVFPWDDIAVDPLTRPASERGRGGGTRAP